MAAHWRLLRSCKGSSPSSPLLFRFEQNLEPATYTLHFTDMVHCWSESLNRRQIIQRAFDLDTSVDPSEDASQMELLLSKIQAALEGQQNTGLSIGENAGDVLNLEATASLPSPLPPLPWSFKLRRMPPNSLSTEFIAPCLGTLSHLQTQVSSLIVQLKEKDHVIDRLHSKLRSAGIELHTVFPNVPVVSKRSKGLSQSSIVNLVKGLKEFDEAAWRASSRLPSEHSTNLLALCRSIFRGDGTGETDLGQHADSEVASNGTVSPQPEELAQDTLHSHARHKPTFPISDDATDDEDFQKQITPESTKLKPLPRFETVQLKPETRDSQEIHEAPDGRSITDGSDDDLATRSPSKRELCLDDQQQTLTTKPKKIGIVGGKRSATPPVIDNTSQARPVEILKSPSKIGRIGGLPKPQQKLEEPARPSGASAASTSSSINPPTKAKQRSSSTSSSDNDQRGRLPSIARPASPDSREDSEERADRKRAELKRTLAEKAKAPLKKKRRF